MRNYFLSDVELGKKDDDHKKHVKDGGLRSAQKWLPSRGPRRRSLKGVALLAVVAFLVYAFVTNMPASLGPNPLMRRPTFEQVPPRSPPRVHPGHPPPSSQANPRSRAQPPSSPERTYNGPVKFLELASSLHAIAPTQGSMTVNKNVLFAAASLKSAATLLPIACQMGTELKSYVHFALMSRSSIDLAELQKVNGIDESCHLIFHDARTENAQISTDARMENAVFRGFLDASSDEEAWLNRGAHQHVKVTGNTLIELPRNSGRSLEWMTKLDSAALRTWNENHIDILISATPGASGSLIRLLRSLSAADYTACSIPHLTIELPSDIDSSAKQFLESFSWPPPHLAGPTSSHQLILRHRIPRQAMTEEESSARFLESFWPARRKSSHVLVLSPQVELSPQFFHYLKYTLLSYRNSMRLFAISLEQPTRLLDEKEPLIPPTSKGDVGPNGEVVGAAPAAFLWQAPSSNAVLFLGQKWMDLHNFTSRSLAAKQDPGPVSSLLADKLVSKKHPSWLEHALRLARMRGYYTLYPGEETAKNLATVHSELYRLPEEYAAEGNKQKLLADDATDEEIEAARKRALGETESSLAPMSLLDSLPNGGELHPLNKLPLLSWDGRKTDLVAVDESAATYAAEFRSTVGGCSTNNKEDDSSEDLLTQDLFCVKE
ncbi:hypothetical protein DL766_008117 [Monosporascus sp. MC13-8B]|nr:hypothetical protein DL763_007592 [Monosporascus cannonballus]RYP20735.1 hypothetical protein DL766_008117 [Monosporascus sp. MC13-8B]